MKRAHARRALNRVELAAPDAAAERSREANNRPGLPGDATAPRTDDLDGHRVRETQAHRHFEPRAERKAPWRRVLRIAGTRSEPSINR